MKCADCDMFYREDDLSDRRAHARHHDVIVNGVRLTIFPKMTITHDVDRIVVITTSSPKPERVFARKVARAANRETRYDFGLFDESDPPDERHVHLFVYCQKERAVGLVILEKRTEMCAYTWDEYDSRVEKDLIGRSPFWSVGYIWTHRRLRRLGIATILVQAAAEYLGMNIGDLGHYGSFTPEGEAWARKTFPDGVTLAR